MTSYLGCPPCGQRFDARAQLSCRSCTLHNGCRLACCPACGQTTVDPAQSRLAQWLAALLTRSRAQQQVAAAAATPLPVERQMILAHAPLDCRLPILGVEDLFSTLGQRIQSYGLTPDHYLRVMQHQP